MRKQIWIRCVIGFAVGVAAMYFVPPLINHGPVSRTIYTEGLLAQLGNPAAATAVTLLVMGLFGALCVAGTLFYDIESWSLARATVTHYLSISLGYLIPNWLLCWGMPLKLLLIIEGIMTVGFFLIWLSLFLFYRHKVRELNELAKKRKK